MIHFDQDTILCIILIFLQVGVIIYFIRRGRIKAKAAAAEVTVTPERTYAGLRQIALNVTPSQLKIAIPNKDTFVYGMVMDWNMGNGTATLAAYATGACSMYLSTGGGIIGGGQTPEVAEMAVAFVTAAKDYLDLAVPAATTSLPEHDGIRFYFLTNHRMYMAEEQLGRFDNNTSPLLPLFVKANEVISGMRANDNGSFAKLNGDS